jgi:hypothetical protein
MIYKTYKTSLGQEYVRIDHPDGTTTCIPPDPANTDYQAYLKWLEEGNVPLPADEVPSE